MSTSTIQIHDSQFGSFAKIAPGLGFNCFEFQAPAGREIINVIDSSPEFEEGHSRPSANGIPVLFPFPNRISHGEFHWDDKNWKLPKEKVSYDATGNAIHGFCLDRPWRVLKQNDSSVTGVFQLSIDAPERLSLWPADFIIEITYKLNQATLRTEIKISNPDNKQLPWGFGTHPYFKTPIGNQSLHEEILVQVPASQEWELKECLPTGQSINVSPEKDLREGISLGQLKLDDVLTGLSKTGEDSIECSLIDQNAGLQILQRCDSGFREMVVFSPPNRNAFCIEPYTCVTDAINLQARGIETGWNVLNPGETHNCWIEIEVSPIIA